MCDKPSYELPDTYCGLEQNEKTLEKSKVVILPVPLEKSTTYSRGTEYGPQAIIEASKNMELYDEEVKADPSEVGIYTDRSLMKSNFSTLDLDQCVKVVERMASTHIKKGKFLISLGGEHSVSIGLVNAYIKSFGKSFTVIQMDAHADLREKYEGSKNNHACVMRRVIDSVPIVQIGIRSLSKPEAEFIDKNKLKVFWAGQNIDDAFIKSVLKEVKTDDIYITFDLDFLDPSVMPAVGTPEPGGYDFADSTFLLKELIRKRNLIGMDFNELMPLKGSSIKHPDFLAAKLVYKSIAYKFLLKGK